MRTGRGSYGDPKELMQLHMYRHRYTSKAWLLSINGDEDRAEWFPLSQITATESDEDAFYIITMPEWLARKHDLIT